jgi:hypothetical protein
MSLFQTLIQARMSALRVGDRVVRGALQLLGGQFGEPALDEVQREEATGRGER